METPEAPAGLSVSTAEVGEGRRDQAVASSTALSTLSCAFQDS
jgi:hypothetical protein